MKNHLLSFYKGEGGTTQFIKDIEYLRKGYGGRDMGVNYAIMKLMGGPQFLYRTRDIEDYLHRLGFVDDKKLDRYRNPYYVQGMGYDSGADGLYACLMVIAGNAIYNEYWAKRKRRFRWPVIVCYTFSLEISSIRLIMRLIATLQQRRRHTIG